MKLLEWLVVMFLIAAGLYCLSMAATGMSMGAGSDHWLHTLLTVCLWTAFPLIAVGIWLAVRHFKKK
ncbi:hypothetical protein JJB07_02890 [Tumebacillus sp. ITR2]|uniref:Uncharacterized protein n=1 Tax=Tumebacillus amylolyticus TaxID=2801339 RepID=A0ABS1J5Q2_9BACL|nr:hypothetical protein [Tumebacillus amylolyticus]MBL0385586.1 hypothetical protein [Tumebacillus amylolyticus]